MKTTNILKNAIAITMIIMIAACSSSKKTTIQKSSGSTEITLPFENKEYKTDKDFFRARQTGKSPDMATAKKIAMQNAKSELASNIQSTVKKVTDQYTNQRTIGDKQEFENKFEELSREVSNQKIGGVKIVGEKLFKENDGSYTAWVVIEVSKQSVLDAMSNEISKNAKLQLDYDKKKFEEIFNQEMQNLENERK